MDFSTYIEKKDRLEKEINSTLQLLGDLKLSRSYEKLNLELKQLQKEKFNLVVIGEFSRGKSTFINAMLGKTILPSSKNATTNVISKIVYGNEPSFKLHYRNGKEQSITEDEFSQIKAQSEGNTSKLEAIKKIIPGLNNSANFDNIEYAKIGYPLDFCKNNVEVVDTPGTNDLNVGRIEITYNYLKNAEAAILVLCATQPLTQSEYEFIKEQVFGNNIKDIFIVINYKDQVLGEEDRVIKHVNDNLRELLIKYNVDISNRIFIVSSRQALLYRRQKAGELLKGKALLDLPQSIEETGFVEFENALGSYLSEEKGLSKLKKYTSCCCEALHEAERDLRLRVEATYHTADDLTEKLNNELPKFKQVKFEASKVVNELRTNLRNHENEIRQIVVRASNRIREAAVCAADNYVEGMTSSDIKYLVETATTPIYKELIKDLNKIQGNVLSNDVSMALGKIRNIWQDMEFDYEAMPIEMQSFSMSSINTGRAVNKDQGESLGVAALGYMLGSFIFGGPLMALAAAGLGYYASGGALPFENKDALIKGQIRNQINASLKGLGDKACDQYINAVDDVCSAIQESIEGRIDTINSQLQELVSQQHDNLEDAESLRKKLNEKQSKVESIEKRLRMI